MTMNRKITFLFALIVALVGVVPMALAQYYDPYGSGDRYEDQYGRYDARVRCESHDRRTNYCDVDTRGGVRLVHQLSDRDCVRGRNWGANERGIWVADGCRGEFELGGGGYGYGNGYARSFRCESNDNRTRYCQVDTRYGVDLVRQLSRSSCIEGRSWGVNRDGVWVSRGCRAEFAVGGNRDDYRYDSAYRRY